MAMLIQVLANLNMMLFSLLLKSKDSLAIVTLILVAPSLKTFEEFVEGYNFLFVRFSLQGELEDLGSISSLLFASCLSLPLTFNSFSYSDFSDNDSLNDGNRSHSPCGNGLAIATFV